MRKKNQAIEWISKVPVGFLFLTMVFGIVQSQPDERFGFIGYGGDQFAKKLTHANYGGSYVTIGNHDASGRIQNLVLDANGGTFNEHTNDRVVRRVGTLNARTDGLGLTPAAYQQMIEAYGLRLAQYYQEHSNPGPCFDWIHLRPCISMPEPPVWHPNVEALIAADAPQIKAAIMRDVKTGRYAGSGRIPGEVVWEIGNEPNLFPYLLPEDYAKLYRAYASYIRATSVSLGYLNTKVVMGAYFSMDMFPNQASKDYILTVLKARGNHDVRVKTDQGWQPGTFLYRAIATHYGDLAVTDVATFLTNTLFRYSTYQYNVAVTNYLRSQGGYFLPEYISVHLYPCDFGASALDKTGLMNVTKNALDQASFMAQYTQNYGGLPIPRPKIRITEFGNIRPEYDETGSALRMGFLVQAFKEWDVNRELRWYFYKTIGIDPFSVLIQGTTAYSRMIDNPNYIITPSRTGIYDDPFPCSRLNAVGSYYFDLAWGSSFTCYDWNHTWGPYE